MVTTQQSWAMYHIGLNAQRSPCVTLAIYTVTDLRRARGTRPPGGQNSFNFMQFLGKFGQIVCWCTPWRLAKWSPCIKCIELSHTSHWTIHHIGPYITLGYASKFTMHHIGHTSKGFKWKNVTMYQIMWSSMLCDSMCHVVIFLHLSVHVAQCAMWSLFEMF